MGKCNSGLSPKLASREACKSVRSDNKGLNTNPVLILSIFVIAQVSFQMTCM